MHLKNLTFELFSVGSKYDRTNRHPFEEKEAGATAKNRKLLPACTVTKPHTVRSLF